jgi:hypothetical protein
VAVVADVKILGHSFKPWMVGAVAIGGVLVLYWAFKNRASAAAATTAATTTATTDPSAIDPSTGIPYSQESGYGGSGLGYGYSYPSAQTSTVQGSAYTSNAQWATAVESGLTSLGWNATDVATALGQYLAQLPLSTSQAAIVRASIAEFGPPPVGSYTVITGSSSPSGGSVPGDVTGLSVTPQSGFADVAWSDVKGASSYELQIAGAGGKGTGTSHVDGAYYSGHAGHVTLSPGRYQARVRARNSAGYGPWSAQHVFTIQKAGK